MREISFVIDKSEVYEEVAKTTGYAGLKMQGDEGALERIGTVDENAEQLDRYWEEAKAEVCRKMRGMVAESEEANAKYKLTLTVGGMFDDALCGSMTASLRSYMILRVTGAWYTLTNKGDAEATLASAATMLDDFRQKAYHKKRLQIPNIYANKDNNEEASVD